MRAVIVAALLVGLCAGSSLAQERVRGRVRSVQAHYDVNLFGDELIVSRLVLDSGHVVDMEGGTLDGVTLEVSHSPVPRVGADVELLVERGRGRVVGGSDAFVANPHRWRASVAEAGVPYYVNAANQDVSASAALTAVKVGADAWALQSDANFHFAYAGATSGSSLVKNFKNEVFFRNVSKSSVIAETYWWYDGAGYLIDADFVFYDGGWRFYTGTSGCNSGAYIEDIRTHEFGHALGLRHTTVSGSTMVLSYSRCSTSFRSLGPDDIAGVEYQYPPVDAVDPAPLPSGSVTLTAKTPKVTVGINWSGASGTSVQVYVNGVLRFTTANDGAVTVTLTGASPWGLQVCEVGGGCSPVVTVAVQ
jgi:hypothetical protein